MSDPTTPYDPPADGRAPGPAGGAPPPPGGYVPDPGPPVPGYQQPAPPYAPPTGAVGRPAELMDRFLARLIDFVIIFVATMFVVGFLIMSMFMSRSVGAFGFGGDFLGNLVSSVLTAALYLGYFSFMESTRGQTIGKMLMKLETRGPDGGRPTMEQAVKRNIWVALGILGVIPFVGGLLAGLSQLAAMILIAVGISGDAVGRRGWHDKLAGTQVVKIG